MLSTHMDSPGAASAAPTNVPVTPFGPRRLRVGRPSLCSHLLSPLQWTPSDKGRYVGGCASQLDPCGEGCSTKELWGLDQYVQIFRLKTAAMATAIPAAAQTSGGRAWAALESGAPTRARSRVSLWRAGPSSAPRCHWH